MKSPVLWRKFSEDDQSHTSVIASRNNILQTAVLFCALALQAEIRGSVIKQKKKKDVGMVQK